MFVWGKCERRVVFLILRGKSIYMTVRGGKVLPISPASMAMQQPMSR